jgi:hypothetical protein
VKPRKPIIYYVGFLILVASFSLIGLFISTKRIKKNEPFSKVADRLGFPTMSASGYELLKESRAKIIRIKDPINLLNTNGNLQGLTNRTVIWLGSEIAKRHIASKILDSENENSSDSWYIPRLLIERATIAYVDEKGLIRTAKTIRYDVIWLIYNKRQMER